MATNLRVSSLPPDLLHRLRVELARAGYTTRQAVLEALEKWIGDHEAKSVAKKKEKTR